MKVRSLFYILKASFWLVIFYRSFSVISKRLLFHFPLLFLLPYRYSSKRTPSSLDKLILFDFQSFEEQINSSNTSPPLTLFGHHHLRTDHLSQHIYHYPASSYFLSNDYPHYSRTYINLTDSSDVKYTWEYGRLQWLVFTSYQYKLKPSPSRLRSIIRTISEFSTLNPCSHGIHWSCTMDVSFRALSLLKIYHILYPSLEDAQTRFLQYLLFQHYIFILCNLELSVVNGNHLNSNLAALVHLCLFFLDLPFSNIILKLCYSLGLNELLQQFDHTGYNYEGSFPYMRLNAELFAYLLYPAHSTGNSLPTHHIHRLRAIRTLFSAITNEFTLTPPIIGDNDSASLFLIEPHTLTAYMRVHSLLCLFEAKHIHTSGKSILSQVSLQAYPCQNVFTTHPVHPTQYSFYHNINGIFCLRTHHYYLSFFNIQAGLRGSGGHTHADYLSFTLSSAGLPLFVDPGTATYSGNPLERDLYRSESMHNVPLRSYVNDTIDYNYSLWSVQSSVKTEPIVFKTTTNGLLVSTAICRNNSSIFRSVIASQSSISIVDYSKESVLYGSRLFLHPSVSPHLAVNNVLLNHRASQQFLCNLQVDPTYASISLHTYYYSPAYGQRTPSYYILIKYSHPFQDREASVFLSF